MLSVRDLGNLQPAPLTEIIRRTEFGETRHICGNPNKTTSVKMCLFENSRWHQTLHEIRHSHRAFNFRS